METRSVHTRKAAGGGESGWGERVRREWETDARRTREKEKSFSLCERKEHESENVESKQRKCSRDRNREERQRGETEGDIKRVKKRKSERR